MTTPRDAMADFIADYYYGEVTRETVLKDADAFLEAMLDFPESASLELAALLNPWRPIETAPKDGTWFVARGPDGTYARISWGRNRHGELAWCSINYWWLEQERKFTHWQPSLPAPPSEDK